MKKVLLLFVLFALVISCKTGNGTKEKNKYEHLGISLATREKIKKASVLLQKYRDSFQIQVARDICMESKYPDYFGGMYIDEVGNPVVLVVDMAYRQEVMKVFRTDSVVVLQCDFSYNKLKSKLKELDEYLENHMDFFRELEITMWGPNIKKNRIEIEMINCTEEKIKLFKTKMDSPIFIFKESFGRIERQRKEPELFVYAGSTYTVKVMGYGSIGRMRCYNGNQL